MNVNDMLKSGRPNATKNVVLTIGFLVYLAAVVYCEVHNISLLLKGVVQGGEILAMIGMVCLGATALALPLAIHYWTHDDLQKIAAFVFYLVDFGLIIMNVVVDYNNNAGGASGLPGWVKIYVEWITPISPVLCAVGWSILWLLDPIQKERSELAKIDAVERKQRTELEATTRIAYLQARSRYAVEDAEYLAMVERAAIRDQVKEGQRVLGVNFVGLDHQPQQQATSNNTRQLPATKLPQVPMPMPVPATQSATSPRIKHRVDLARLMNFSADGGDNHNDNEEENPELGGGDQDDPSRPGFYQRGRLS